MKLRLTHFGLCSLLALLTGISPAAAELINFDSQAVMQGGNLTGIPDSPLMISTVTFISNDAFPNAATFTGGELLNAEVGLNADQTGVYASEGLFGSGETNPLVITFALPVDAFSVFVANGDDTRNYTVSDDLGDSITKSLPSAGALGTATFSLPGNGITTVDITSANTNAWDFAIDDVSFITATAVPEPESLFLLAAGSILVAAVRRRHVRALLERSWASAREPRMEQAGVIKSCGSLRHSKAPDLT